MVLRITRRTKCVNSGFFLALSLINLVPKTVNIVHAWRKRRCSQEQCTLVKLSKESVSILSTHKEYRGLGYKLFYYAYMFMLVYKIMRSWRDILLLQLFISTCLKTSNISDSDFVLFSNMPYYSIIGCTCLYCSQHNSAARADYFNCWSLLVTSAFKLKAVVFAKMSQFNVAAVIRCH